MIGLTLTFWFSPPQEYWKQYQELPPLEWIKNPYEVAGGNGAEAKKRNWFVNWYWMEFLPAAACATEFPTEFRLYNLPVQPLGKHKMAVTKESEAFGAIVVENCYSKWQHIVPEKVKDNSWKCQDYDKHDSTTHKWHNTRWSDGRNGQVKGQGWSNEAYDELNAAIRRVKAFRKQDKANKWAGLQACLQVVKAANDIPLDADGPAKKKRKKSKSDEPPPVYAEIENLSDDEWEDPGGVAV